MLSFGNMLKTPNTLINMIVQLNGMLPKESLLHTVVVGHWWDRVILYKMQ